MTTISLSKRVMQTKPSSTVLINARANELRAMGHHIINLSVGEPDFDTPDFIKQAGIKAIEEGFTKYTAIDGITPLKDAIIHKLARDNDLHYQVEQIIASCGVKHALFNLTQVILNEDDEAVVPAPYWVSYPAMVSLAGAHSVIIKTNIDQHFKISPEQLDAAMTAKTRLFFLNSPSNPSGMAYTAAELRALADVLLEYPQVLIASDDMYEYIYWGAEPYANILNVAPELAERTVVFNGLSKAYAMTGWRIGYAAGPANIINAMKTIQSQNTTNPTSFVQKAAVVALQVDPSYFNEMREAYHRRHNLVYNALCQMLGVRCLPADGTFYLFPEVSEAIEKLNLKTDLELAERLLTEANIAIVPGTEFGAPGHLRISYAVQDETLETAMKRMSALITP